MSYCRWSSDDFQCDLYIWEDVSGGWVIAVASRRSHWKVDLPEPIKSPRHGDDHYAWAARQVERYAAISRLREDPSTHEWIDLPTPPGGDYREHPTAAACADDVEYLISIGFQCPAGVVESLRADHEEGS